VALKMSAIDNINTEHSTSPQKPVDSPEETSQHIDENVSTVANQTLSTQQMYNNSSKSSEGLRARGEYVSPSLSQPVAPDSNQWDLYDSIPWEPLPLDVPVDPSLLSKFFDPDANLTLATLPPATLTQQEEVSSDEIVPSSNVSKRRSIKRHPEYPEMENLFKAHVKGACVDGKTITYLSIHGKGLRLYTLDSSSTVGEKQLNVLVKDKKNIQKKNPHLNEEFFSAMLKIREKWDPDPCTIQQDEIISGVLPYQMQPSPSILREAEENTGPTKED
jgi:hypothetical protein